VELTDELVRAAFAAACPQAMVREVAGLDLGYANRHWLFHTDEGPLLLKIPVRNTDPDHLRNLLAATRVAGELGIPVSKYPAFVPHFEPLGAPVLVQEFVPGTQAAQQWAQLPLPARQDTAATLGRWVGALHTRRGAELTNLIGGRRHESVAAQVDADLTEALTVLHDAGVDADLTKVRVRIERGVAEFGPVEPTLCHRDVYLDNVLLTDGAPSRLLDFEHARFSDQFAEFGKLRELVFDWYPETEAPFMAAYEELHPLDDAARHRIDVHIGLYNVVMCGYFCRWTPGLVPAYLDRISAWLAARS
jgi:Ser/Thr protein kinase RdoA (MazF antagonist)